MKLLHVPIMNLEGWLRGLHDRCPKEDYSTIWMNITLDLIEETPLNKSLAN